MSLVIVIGRGHSGTRAIAQTLRSSGVYMGENLNSSCDLIPPDKMFEACRMFGSQVRWKGRAHWYFAPAIKMDAPPEFNALVEDYLRSVLESPAVHKGWKLPETLLALPWIVRRFPEAHYIYWIRDPRDCILGEHGTDNLNQYGVECPDTDEVALQRALSWKYQYDLVQATPKPKHWIEVRFEDFVLRQDATLTQLEAYLGFPLGKIAVRPESVGRWRSDEGFDFLCAPLKAYGYL